MNAVRTKILAGYVILAAFSVVLTVAIYVLGSRVEHDVAEMRDRVLPHQRMIGELRVGAGRMETAMYAYYARSLNKDAFKREFNMGKAGAAKLAEDIARTTESGKPLAGLVKMLVDDGVALEATLSKDEIDWDAARATLAKAGQDRDALHKALDALFEEVDSKVKVSTHAVFQQVSLLTKGAVGFLIVIAITIAGVWRFAATSIVEPINDMAEFAQKVERDADLRGAADIKSDDEIGRTATAFNAMLAKIRGVVGLAAGASDEVMEAASELDGIMSGASTSVSAQLECVRALELAIEAVREQLSEVATSTGAAANRATTAANEADTGRDQLGNSVFRIKQLAQSVEQSSEAIARLEGQTVSIGGLTGTIKEIADQTNLLALNAAIEAARAGEAGRGFAVVADEVRKLSQKTQSATQEIDATLSEVVASVHSIVTLMATNRSDAAGCADDSENTEKRLATVIDMMGELRSDSCRIAEVTERSHNLAEDIGRRVGEVARLANNVESDIGRSAQQAARLAGNARDLRGRVQQFRY
jgi:methyl-accepting chemotaxis protein